ncbi:MAG: hypothetical protein RMK51_10450 [Meiothermus sp.]|uniref:variant leucine-rich repeat-containing protein n=1 Tax=Meiothermus sp. TaxID=1955249 RepID=UPI00298F09F2|nr:hypothetical protein [Meiothermus sp.]MDW8426345.1 hypothetical protein [Meiothermus sp.]
MTMFLEEAQNPKTAPERLRALASRPEAEVRRAVAANPNTPEAVLWRLAVHFPEAVLSNALLELLWLVNPNWLAEMPGYARQRLLSCPEAPAPLLRWAVREGDTPALLSLLQNPAAPPEWVEALCAHPLLAVAEAARLHIGLEAEPLEAALGWCEVDLDYLELRQLVLLGMAPSWLAPRLAQEPDTTLRLALLEQPDLPRRVLEAFLFDDEEEVRRAARQHPATPPETARMLHLLEAGLPVEAPFEALLGGPDGLYPQANFWIRRLLAAHPETPRHLLERLLTDDDWRVRVALAANPGLPEAWFLTLAQDGDRDVRRALAANPRTPAGLLGPLLADEYEEVREAAAQNPQTPAEWRQGLERLQGKDPGLTPEELEGLAALGPYGRRLVAAHPNAAFCLEHLHTDPDWQTRLAVAQHPRTPPAVLTAMVADTDPEVRQAVALHPATPLPGLEQLARDEQPEVRVRVAENPRTPAAVLRLLAQDDHWQVRQAVARHPSTPLEALQKLGRDPDPDVQQAVADHPEASPEALEAFLTGWVFPPQLPLSPGALYRKLREGESLPPEWLETLARGPERARRLVAAHPDTPQPTLEALLRDEDWRVRQALAQNPALPPGLLLRLAADADVDVRRAAFAHPGAGVEVLAQVRPDDPPDLRLLAARHPQTPLPALQRLLGDPDPEVRQAARAHPAVPAAWLEQYRRAEALEPSLDAAFLRHLAAQEAWGRGLAARHPASPRDVLEALQSDEDGSVRLALAQNPALPAEILTQLAQDADRDVRLAVAAHPSAAPEALQELLRDTDEEVRLAALRNPRLPEPTLAAYRRQLVLRASRSRFALNRAVALSRPEMPPLELAKVRHWAAPEWLVRYAVAQNPNTPLEVLRRLAQDGNRWVRKKALEALPDRKP